jgi:hypothetical protein
MAKLGFPYRFHLACWYRTYGRWTQPRIATRYILACASIIVFTCCQVKTEWQCLYLESVSPDVSAKLLYNQDENYPGISLELLAFRDKIEGYINLKRKHFRSSTVNLSISSTLGTKTEEGILLSGAMRILLPEPMTQFLLKSLESKNDLILTIDDDPHTISHIGFSPLMAKVEDLLDIPLNKNHPSNSLQIKENL